MSTSILAVNDGGHSSPRASNPDQGNREYQPHHKMTIISPKKEDLRNSSATVAEANVDHTRWRRMIHALGSIIGSMGALPCCIICPNPNKNIEQGNVGLVTKFGCFYKIVDPGPVAINPLSESLIQVDVKIQAVEVPEQVYITKDNATQRLAVAITYQIVSPHIAAFGVHDVRQALIGRTKTALRHIVGARVLQDVIDDSDEITQSLREIIDDVAPGWGLLVESMLIKNIRSS